VIPEPINGTWRMFCKSIKMEGSVDLKSYVNYNVPFKNALRPKLKRLFNFLDFNCSFSNINISDFALWLLPSLTLSCMNLEIGGGRLHAIHLTSNHTLLPLRL